MMMASDGVTVAEGPNVGGGASSGPGGGGGGNVPTVVVSPGSICGRIQANPLKHLASLLREKLRAAQGGPCNLVQVATEIHSQAESYGRFMDDDFPGVCQRSLSDKHNTTMRRIYDVVNVCEGAGVLARTAHRFPEWKEKPAADQNVMQRYVPFRRTGKRALRGGAEIQWLGGTILEENDRTPQIPCQNQKLLLEIEKGQIADRILQKKRLCDALSMQVAILQSLLERNQAQCRLYPNVSRSWGSADGVLCVPGSMERRCSSSEVASMNSETDLRPSTEDRNVCTDLASPQSLDEYCDVDDFICDYFVDEQRPSAAKRLHLPFVMLATTPEANVNISMSGDPSCQVHLELDRNYCLLDHIQVIKMLPEGRANKPQWQPEP